MFSGLMVAGTDFFSKKKYYPLAILLLIFAVITLSLLSGMRNYMIGTDTATYDNFFITAVNSNNFSRYFYNLTSTDSLEQIFVLLIYIVSRISNNYHFFQFICALIINANIGLALYLSRNKLKSMSLGWITYCFLLYVNTLNIVRQSIALSFMALAISLLLSKKFYQACVVIIIACLFHKTAIIGLVIILVAYLFNHIVNSKRLFLVIGLSLFITILIPFLMPLLGNINVFVGSKYSNYLVSTGGISLLFGVLLRLPMLLLIAINFVLEPSLLKSKNNWLFLLLIQELFLLPLQIINPVIGRIVLYFSISKVIAYPLAISEFKSKKSFLKLTVVFLYLILIMGTFTIQVLVNGEGQIYPYFLN